MPIQDELLKILVCPVSKQPLVYDAETDSLISTDPKTRRRYPIENGIPIMLADDDHSQELGEREWEEALAQARRTEEDETAEEEANEKSGGAPADEKPKGEEDGEADGGA